MSQTASWTASDAQLKKVAADAGMDVSTTKNQMSGFIFPTAAEQKEASSLVLTVLRLRLPSHLVWSLRKPGAWNVDQKISKVITGEYLD